MDVKVKAKTASGGASNAPGATVKRRTVHYKKARFYGIEGNLQHLLSAALKSYATVGVREEQVVIGGQTRRVISAPTIAHGMQTGRLLQFTVGQRQSLMELDPTGTDYKLMAVSAQRKSTGAAAVASAKSVREFVESQLYFAVKDNHVLVLGSTSLSSKSIEAHFNWLLQTSGALTSSQTVLLEDEMTLKAKDAFSVKTAHEIELGSDLDWEDAADDGNDVVNGSKKMVPAGDANGLMKTWLGEWFGSQPLTVAKKRNERVHVKLSVKYKSRTKSTAGFELMERVARAARHFDPSDYKVKLYKGGELKGKDLKVFGPIDITIYANGLADEASIWKAMHSWFLQKVADHTISVT